MIKKLHISLILCKLVVLKLLITNHRMHNLYAIFAKFLEICKRFSKNLVYEHGNISRSGRQLKQVLLISPYTDFQIRSSEPSPILSKVVRGEIRAKKVRRGQSDLKGQPFWEMGNCLRKQSTNSRNSLKKTVNQNQEKSK